MEDALLDGGVRLLHKSNENTGKNSKNINIFRTLGINQQLATRKSIYSRKMAESRWEQWALWYLNLPYFYLILPSSTKVSKANRLRLTDTERTRSWAATEWSETGLELPRKPHLQKIVTIWPVWQFPGEVHLQGFSLFNLTQNLLNEESPNTRIFVKEKKKSAIV